MKTILLIAVLIAVVAIVYIVKRKREGLEVQGMYGIGYEPSQPAPNWIMANPSYFAGGLANWGN